MHYKTFTRKQCLKSQAVMGLPGISKVIYNKILRHCFRFKVRINSLPFKCRRGIGNWCEITLGQLKELSLIWINQLLEKFFAHLRWSTFTSWFSIRILSCTNKHVSIYAAMTNSYHRYSLSPWYQTFTTCRRY